MNARSLSATLVALAAPALQACAAPDLGRPDPAPETRRIATAASADSLLGTIAVVGAHPARRVVLQTRAGDQMVLSGATLPRLRSLDGIEIRCSGRVQAGMLEVDAFRVVRAHGLPARDGVLEIEGDVAVLRGPDGEAARYRPLPSELREWAGRHVWIAGPPDGTPQAWGLIDAAH